MNVVIRPAELQDVRTVAETIDLAFKEQPDETRIARALNQVGRCSLVAELDGQVTGFIDGFQTTAQDGTRRWELDLLAVHPEFQSGGIGRNLIKNFTESVASSGTAFVRTLIRVQNTPMHHAITACGYQRQSEICGLYVSTVGSDFSGELPVDSHVVSVTTFTYSGAWLEGTITAEQIQLAQRMIKTDGFDVVGSVVPVSNLKAVMLLEASDFEQVGQYQWWTKGVNA